VRGFTLIELLVYVALLAVILTLATQFILTVVESAARMDAKDEVGKNAVAIARTFDYIARHSNTIYGPTSDFVSDPGQVSFVSNINLPEDENETYTDIYVDNDKFCTKKEISGVDCVTSSRVKVTSLIFTVTDEGLSSESVQMRATVRFNSPRPEYYFADTIQTSVRLRNY